MAHIKFIKVPDGSAPLYARKALLDKVFEAETVDSYDPKPNTNGRAYKIDSDHIGQILKNTGEEKAAHYWWSVNQFPAMQRIGILFPTASAEAASYCACRVFTKR